MYQNPLGNVSPDDPNSAKNIVEGACEVTESNKNPIILPFIGGIPVISVKRYILVPCILLTEKLSNTEQRYYIGGGAEVLLYA